MSQGVLIVSIMKMVSWSMGHVTPVAITGIIILGPFLQVKSHGDQAPTDESCECLLGNELQGFNYMTGN